MTPGLAAVAPGSYFTDEERLYLVVKIEPDSALCEDVADPDVIVEFPLDKFASLRQIEVDDG